MQTIYTIPISERRGDGSIVTSLYTKFTWRIGLSRVESQRVCTARGGNDRHCRNRTEREGREAEWREGRRARVKKAERVSAERDESMKASGFAEG